jgi:DUF4097 and DUF4098 domain-containing protein YvlB
MKNFKFLILITLLLSLLVSYTGCSVMNSLQNIFPYVTGKIEKTIDIKQPLNLEILTSNGNIDIEKGNNNVIKINIDYKVIAKNQEDAARISKLIEEDLPFQINGNIAQIGNLNKYNLKHWTSIENVFMSFVVEVPFDSLVEATSSLGNITVKNINGPVRINTNSGNINVTNIQNRVDANTLNGNIKAENIYNSSSFNSAKGNLAIYNSPGDIFLKTGLGNIFLNSRIRNSANWKITTSLGNIEILLPSITKVFIDGKTDFGKFISEFPIVYTYQKENEVEGSIGENPLSKINLKTGSGNITIKKLE